MVWAGVALVLLSYVLVPRRPALGWAAALAGNAVALRPYALLHRPDMMAAPVAFALLSAWNLWNELRSTR